jgi:hypothetical protein
MGSPWVGQWEYPSDGRMAAKTGYSTAAMTGSSTVVPLVERKVSRWAAWRAFATVDSLVGTRAATMGSHSVGAKVASSAGWKDVSRAARKAVWMALLTVEMRALPLAVQWGFQRVGGLVASLDE